MKRIIVSMITVTMMIVSYIPTIAFAGSNDVQTEKDVETIQEEVESTDAETEGVQEIIPEEYEISSPRELKEETEAVDDNTISKRETNIKTSRAEEPNIIEIKSGDLPSSGDWEKQVNEIGESILTQLEAKPVGEYEKVIAKASIEKKKEIHSIYEEVIADIILDKGKLDINENNKVSNTDVPLVVLDETAYQQLTTAFVISDVAVFEISPLFLSLEIVGSDLDSDVSSKKNLDLDTTGKGTTHSTPGNSTKVYYSGGTKVATAKVKCNFY